MDQQVTQVSQNKQFNTTYKITYRCARPNMDQVYTKEFVYCGDEANIVLAIKRELGKYGGLKAEKILQEKI